MTNAVKLSASCDETPTPFETLVPTYTETVVLTPIETIVPTSTATTTPTPPGPGGTVPLPTATTPHTINITK